MKLYLIRHGQTESNVAGALDTALPGPPLTELGQQQAGALAERLGGEPVVAVYASRARRAQQTAVPLAAAFDLEVQVIDGVQETQAGELELRSDRAALDTYIEVFGGWTRGELAGSMPGGESGAQVRSRMLSAVDELRAKHAEAHPDGVVALVSHGGAIRLAGEWLTDNVGPEIADRQLLPNTAIVRLETTDTGWHCLSWAEIVP